MSDSSSEDLVAPLYFRSRSLNPSPENCKLKKINTVTCFKFKETILKVEFLYFYTLPVHWEEHIDGMGVRVEKQIGNIFQNGQNWQTNWFKKWIEWIGSSGRVIFMRKWRSRLQKRINKFKVEVDLHLPTYNLSITNKVKIFFMQSNIKFSFILPLIRQEIKNCSI